MILEVLLDLAVLALKSNLTCVWSEVKQPWNVLPERAAHTAIQPGVKSLFKLGCDSLHSLLVAPVPPSIGNGFKFLTKSQRTARERRPSKSKARDQPLNKDKVSKWERSSSFTLKPRSKLFPIWYVNQCSFEIVVSWSTLNVSYTKTPMKMSNWRYKIQELVGKSQRQKCPTI